MRPRVRPSAIRSLLIRWPIAAAVLVLSGIASVPARAQSPLVLAGHAEYVNAVAFSPNGELLAALALNEVTIWRPTAVPAKRLVARFRVDQQITHHWMAHTPIQFTPDGEKVCVATVDAANLQAINFGLSFYTLDGKRVKTPVDDRYPKKAAHDYFSFSPDGKQVACSLSGGLLLRNLETGAAQKFTQLPTETDDAKPGEKPAAQIPSDKEFHIEDIRFLPDGKTLATARMDGLVRFWDLKERKLLREVQMDTAGVWYQGGGSHGGSAGFYENSTLSPNGKYGAAVSSRPQNIETLTLWDLEAGKPLFRLATSPGKYFIRGHAWTADNKWLATGGYPEWEGDHIVAIYHLETGKEALKFALPKNYGDIRQKVFSPDGRLLAVSAMPYARKYGPPTNQVLIYDVSKITGPKPPPKARPGRPAPKAPVKEPAANDATTGEPAEDVPPADAAAGKKPAGGKSTSRPPVSKPKASSPNLKKPLAAKS